MITECCNQLNLRDIWVAKKWSQLLKIPILDTSIYICPLCVTLTVPPPWTLKGGGLERSVQKPISLNIYIL